MSCRARISVSGARTIQEYRINRGKVRVSTFRRLVGYGIVR